ncbi:MAG TPA: hypothetical protein PLP75_06170 [Burkholderiales bacterium]|nr:hypothetical protein [Burkholderiales bacterium]
MNTKYFNMLIIMMLASSLMACGEGGASSGASASPQPGPTPNKYTEVTFDNVATIPVFASSSTRTTVFVHNYSNHKITGISYTSSTDDITKTQLKKVSGTLLAKTGLGEFIDPISASQCSVLGALSSCPIIINTPVLDAKSPSASGLITLNYTFEGKKYQNSQIVNMSLTDNTSSKGVQFSQLSTLHSNFDTAYATLYVYGTGSGQSYLVDSLKASDKQFLNITQNDPTGTVIPSEFVQAFEIELPKSNLPYTTNLDLYSSIFITNNNKLSTQQVSKNTASNFSSNLIIGVSGSFVDGPVLVSSLPAVVNTVDSTQGEYFILNAGNSNATISSVSSSSNSLTLLSGGCTAGTTLGAGDPCTVKYQIESSANPSTGVSSGTINVTSNAGSLSTPVYWYNSFGGALVAMTPSSGTMSITQGGNGNTTITVQNIGGYPLNIGAITVTPSVNSQLVSSGINNNNCGYLPIGGTCTFGVTASSNSQTNGSLFIFLNATYTNSSSNTNSYARMYPLPFIVISTEPNLVMSTVPTLTTYSNGTSESSTAVTITNTGKGPAQLTSESFDPIPSPSSLLSNDGACGSGTLESGHICTTNVTLGPIQSTGSFIGTAHLTIGYKGVNGTYNSNAATPIQYSVTPPSLVITGIQVNGSSTTGGSSSSPLQFYGYTPNQSIAITYQNMTGDTITIKGIQDNVSNYTWSNNGTGCTVNTIVPAGQLCTITYTSNLANVAAAGTSASFSINLSLPTLTVNIGDNSYFQTTPTYSVSGNSVIYANTSQAVLTNQVKLQNLGLFQIVESVAWSGGGSGNYSPISVTASMESYGWDPAPLPLPSQCSLSSLYGNSITQLTCSNINVPTAGIISTFQISSYVEEHFPNLSMHVLFDVDTNGQVIATSTNYLEFSVTTPQP